MSGLHLYRAARVEALAAALAANLTQFQPLNPFAPLTISVGNKGMERWLRSVLAVHHGIAANLKFPFPRQAVTSLLDMEPAQDAPWQRDTLAWRVLTAMETLQDEPALAPLQQWLQSQPANDTGGQVPLHRSRWSLATEIALALDRVAVYRPDWLQAWSTQATQDIADTAVPAWQPALWRVLQDQVSTRHPSLRLQDAQPQPGDALHVFAVSSLPRIWLETLRRAATVRDIFVYHLTPSDLYWGEYRTAAELRRNRKETAMQWQARQDQHPLLTALGKVARDHMEMLLDGEFLDETVMDGFAAEHEDTALAVLQYDLIHATSLEVLAGKRPNRVLQAGDHSLQFHACHGPARQVEVLRDVLLALLDADKTLQYRDIVVMTPDVKSYAPLVKAVLGDGHSSYYQTGGWGQSGGPKLPVYVADLGLRELNPLADGLLRVLELAGGRLTASGLADLCSCPAVMLRFGLTDDDIALIHQWLREAGARWGADAAERKANGQPEQHAYTLAFALQRLALGLAMADDGQVDVCGLGPLDEMEGESRGTFGRFSKLCAQLLYWRAELQRPRPMTGWKQALAQVSDAMTATSTQAAFLRAELNEGLVALETESAGWAGDVALDALQTMLQARFERGRGGDRLQLGAVTLCALTPMRSVPFRVVCLLGMDDSAFPRAVVQRGFDAVAARPRAGDQDPREDDRNLLLEALLSARDHFVVLYSGRDIQTDGPLAPAVPIGDLLDTVDATFAVEQPLTAEPEVRPRDLLTVHHSVQPFSPSGFAPLPDQPWSPRPKRYDQRMLETAYRLLGPRQALPAVLGADSTLDNRPFPDHMSLPELLRWLRQPVEQLFQSGLGLYLKEAQEVVEDREGLELDTLEKWGLGGKVCQDWRTVQWTADALHQHLLGRAGLPPGMPGKVLVLTALEELARCKAAVGPLEPPRKHDIALTVPGTPSPLLLTGSVQTDGDQLVRLALEEPDKPRRLLEAWLQLVVCNAAAPGSVQRARLVGLGAKNTKDIKPAKTIDLLAPEDPMAVLVNLVDVVRAAWATPIPLCEKTSYAYAKAYLAGPEDEEGRQAKAMAEAAKQWSDPHAEGCEVNNPALAAVFGTTAPYLDEDGGLDPAFQAWALQLWQPILQAQVKVAKGAKK